jgi:hypothetical protein
MCVERERERERCVAVSELYIPVDLFRLLTYVFQIKYVGRVHSNHKLDDDRVSWLLPPSFF